MKQTEHDGLEKQKYETSEHYGMAKSRKKPKKTKKEDAEQITEEDKAYTTRELEEDF